MREYEKEKIGIFLLIIVTFLWGAGYPAIEFANKSIMPIYQIAFRFLIAGIILSILFIKKIKQINKEVLKTSFILSIPLFILYFLSVVGIKYTTASRASFYCCLAILIVPFISFFILKTVINKKSCLCIAICVVGILLVSFSNEGNLGLNLGDILCLMCSVSFAFHIVLTEKLLKEKDATLITMVQMYFVSLIGFFIAPFFEEFPSNVVPISIYSLIFMGILCTAFAFWVQTHCLKFISSTKVAMIFTLEPVFGASISWIVLGQSLNLKGIIGGILIVISLILSELNFENSLQRKVK